MKINALMMYGSCARGDYSASSDIDLLGLSGTGDEGKTRLYSIGNLKINIYSEDDFRALSMAGSLYVWHLRSEGKILLDLNGILERNLNLFSLKRDYSDARHDAALVGWLLFSPEVRNTSSTLIISTITYCVRTIAYSYLAEKAIPAFSLRDVVPNLKDDPFLADEVKYLWSLKMNNHVSDLDMNRFDQFLQKHVGPHPSWYGNSLSEIANIYADKTNFVGKRCRELLIAKEEPSEPIDKEAKRDLFEFLYGAV